MVSSIEIYLSDLICTISMSGVFTQPKRSGVCIRSNTLLACCVALHFFPFNFICNMATFRKNCFDHLTSSHESRVCKMHSICLNCVLYFILVNFLCNMTIFGKDFFLAFRPYQWVEGVCMGKIFGSMLLYTSCLLICYATGPYTEKVDFGIDQTP